MSRLILSGIYTIQRIKVNSSPLIESRQLTVHSTNVDTTNDELIPIENYADAKLQTNYTKKQLEQRLLNTYYAARTYIEEQGVNILFIAFGMLQWYESTVRNGKWLQITLWSVIDGIRKGVAYFGRNLEGG